MTYTAQDRRQSFLGRMALQQACFHKALALDLVVESEVNAFLATLDPGKLRQLDPPCIYVHDDTFRRWRALLTAARRLRFWPDHLESRRPPAPQDWGIKIDDRMLLPESWRSRRG